MQSERHHQVVSVISSCSFPVYCRVYKIVYDIENDTTILHAESEPQTVHPSLGAHGSLDVEDIESKSLVLKLPSAAAAAAIGYATNSEMLGSSLQLPSDSEDESSGVWAAIDLRKVASRVLVLTEVADADADAAEGTTIVAVDLLDWILSADIRYQPQPPTDQTSNQPQPQPSSMFSSIASTVTQLWSKTEAPAEAPAVLAGVDSPALAARFKQRHSRFAVTHRKRQQSTGISADSGGGVSNGDDGSVVRVRQSRDLCSAEVQFVEGRTRAVQPTIRRLIRKLDELFAANENAAADNDVDDDIVIGLCGSGGGYRAMVGTLGFLRANLLAPTDATATATADESDSDPIRLTDIATYYAALSGSTWQHGPFLAKYEEYMTGDDSSGSEADIDRYASLLKRRALRGPTDIVRSDPMGFLSTVRSLYHYKTANDSPFQDFSSVDVFGHLLGEMLLYYDVSLSNASADSVSGSVVDDGWVWVPRDSNLVYRMSRIIASTSTITNDTSETSVTAIGSGIASMPAIGAGALSEWSASNDRFPFPIFSAVAFHNDIADMEWLEITPFESGCACARAFIPTPMLGRPFDSGRLLAAEHLQRSLDAPLPPHWCGDELPLQYILGICGSAFTSPLEVIINNVFSGALKVFLRRLIQLMHIHCLQLSPARLPNWMKNMNIPYMQDYITKDAELTVIDAGAHVNLPIFPLLRPERRVDIIIALDSSDPITNYPDLLAAKTYADMLLARPTPGTDDDHTPIIRPMPDIPQPNPNAPPYPDPRDPQYSRVFGIESYPETPIVVYMRGVDRTRPDEAEYYLPTADFHMTAEHFDALCNHTTASMQHRLTARSLHSALSAVRKAKRAQQSPQQ